MYYTARLALLWLLQCFRWGLIQLIIDWRKVKGIWQNTKKLGKNSAWIKRIWQNSNPYPQHMKEDGLTLIFHPQEDSQRAEVASSKHTWNYNFLKFCVTSLSTDNAGRLWTTANSNTAACTYWEACEASSTMEPLEVFWALMSTRVP